MKHSFLTVIDKFSKFAAAYYLPDRNHVTIIEQLEDHFAKIGKPEKIVAGNEFNSVQIKDFLQEENVSLHLTKAHSHTGIADVESLHRTLAEKFRTLIYQKVKISTRRIIQKAVINYNQRFHSTIKATPIDVQNRKVNFDKIRKNLQITKEKVIEKRNQTREDYIETRSTGLVKNYKATRQKHLPKFRKVKLHNVHPVNIKRKLKFTDQAKELEIPFTEEEKSIIDKAVNNGPLSEILISKFNISISRRDIKTLIGEEWLNDQIINFYLNLLKERSEQNGTGVLPKVHVMNTFFIPCFLRSGYNAVRRWTRKINIFSYDLIMIPVHVNEVHWCIAVIDFRNNKIQYYDPMRKENPNILDKLEEYLRVA